MNKIVLLGTGGGPRIWSQRSQPSSALVIEDDIYIIDTGDGVCNQLANANLDPEKIKAIFITHNHSDHVADFGTLLLRTWQSGHKGKIQCYGPTPLRSIIDSYKEYMKWDIELRIREENRPHFETIFNVNEIEKDSHIYKDKNISVECITVPHAAAKPSFAYKFKLENKFVVFSGDTSKSEKLIKFALNSEYLIEKTYPGNEAFKKHIINGHTSIEEVGYVAKKSNVKNLILNHLVPTGSPEYDLNEIWKQGVSDFFDGNIIVGEDLLEINI